MQGTSVRARVLIDALIPRFGVGREAVLMGTGTLFLALAAQVQVLLPFSPVPVTGQTFAVLLLGALYGSRRAPATVLTYLSVGALGLPVFAAGGWGLARLAGPTGGYLVGFLAAAYVVGALAERGWDRRPWTTAASMVLGNAVIYTTGALWLCQFVGARAVLATGVLPFLPGDAAKVVLAMLLLPAGWRLIGRGG